MTKEQGQPNNLKQKVLAELMEKQIEPTSRWYWRTVELSLWFLWGLSILVGALSVAILLFAGTHNWYALVEATHETRTSFWVEVLPYLWVVVFTLMASLAYVNFRCTKHGYRHPIIHVLLSSLIFSVFSGVILHMVGVGSVIDTKLGKTMPMYESQEEMELKHWQSPNEGRLVGRVVDQLAASNTYVFLDINDMAWKIEVDELRPADQSLLSSGKQVRILGMTSSTADTLLRACGVFPWMFGPKLTLDDMRKERDEFVAKLSTYVKHERAESIKGDLRDALLEDDEESKVKNDYCPEMPVLRRMRPDLIGNQ